MNVFLTIAGIEPEAGGPSRSVPCLAHHLALMGAEVRLKSIGNDAVCKDNLSYGLDLYMFDRSFMGRMNAIDRMVRDLTAEVCEQAGRSVVHDQGIWLMNNHAAVAAARKSGTPLIISPRGMLEPWSMNNNALKKKVAWQLYQRCDLESSSLIHVTSQQEADNVQKLCRKPVAIIPNGVDVPVWRERDSSSSGRKTILFLSRIHPKKGLLNLVSAWQKIKKTGWKIVIAGPDESNHRQEVEEAIREAELQEYFEFTGPVDDVAKWDLYFQSDLFVLPTYSENFGIVVAEALACGVPVITTTGTPWKSLHTHKCGWWVDVGVQSLADALASALACPDSERRDMGVRGREMVESSYGWSKIAGEMLSAYEWVLHGGSPPPCVRIY
ncbi:MAG: glycosyltransferase [Geobacteraceae bacterium]|nr:glycosyltransferase [Geobacteraceae bacterium]